MIEPKQWNAGVADEAWKVLVCGRDLHLLTEMRDRLCCLLSGKVATAEALADVAQMSGAQIVEAIERKRVSLEQTINNGIKKASA